MADKFFDWLEKNWYYPVLAVLGFIGLKFYYFQIVQTVLSFVGTILLGWVAWRLWLHYIQQDFILGIDWVLLEIVPPRDVDRSPKAMELFFTNALYHWSFKGGVEEYWQGAVWFWFSLEIVSLEGQVHFYIRTPSRIKPLIETQMYAQFPQAQVKVAEDYTLAVDEISAKSVWQLWGCEFMLLKPEAFPIKTYIDFGLDDDPKEEYKIDPLSPLIELFGSMQKDEQMWMQIVVTPSKKKYHTPGTWWGTHDWVAEAEIQLKKLLDPYTNIRTSTDGTRKSIEMRAPKFLDNIVDAMSKKVLKLGFESGIRVCYVAKKTVFDQNKRRALRLVFRQYSMPSQNELWRTNSTQADNFGKLTPELFMSEASLTRVKDRMLTEYRERSFFHTPLRHNIPFPWPISPLIFPKYFHEHTFVLNTEELATLWHFPGQILKVPTLERIESKEASPPPNLPT